jgi:type IV pilus assembly protein PilV
MNSWKTGRGEKGVMLLEALIAILIFSIGILALIAMQSRAIAYSSDAKYRSDASFLANDIIGQMWLDRANIANYASPGGSSPELAAWIVRVNATLPGTTIAGNTPVIAVNAVTGEVDVTIKWQLPSGEGARTYRSVGLVSAP